MTPALRGLTSAQAARQLSLVGFNEAATTHRLSGVAQFLSLFLNPLVITLVVASIASAFIGEPTDAAIIALIVLTGTALNFWQTSRSQRAADTLRASVSPTATVHRDDRWTEVPMRLVVPGDLVRLTAGDLVPADALVLESKDLAVDQAMLTGESLPADKHARPGATSGGGSAAGSAGESAGESTDAPLVDRGAAATPGSPDDEARVFLGTSVVSGTGLALVVATGPRTLFGDIARRLGTRAPESEFDRGIRHFSWLILRTTMALVFFILAASLAMRRDPLESLLFAVALGVGLTPEFLPMIASVTLTAGAIRMAREHVIVKHPPAIQNFGSIDVLCSDKTGTLTAGRMSLVQSLDAAGAPSPRPLFFAALNSQFETGLRNPLDAAILAQPGVDTAGYAKVDEVPFDFQRRRLSIVVTAADGSHLLITKGAPEAVLECVSHVETTAGSAAGVQADVVTARPLSDDARERCLQSVASLGDLGQRVIAVGIHAVEPKRAYGRDDERGLTLVGLLAFADPIRDDAAAAVAALRRDGVSVKLFTGDSDRVARAVCRAVGLDCERVLTGSDLAHLDDAALGHVAEQVDVFARVSPAQKNRLLLALKRRGHVVGFIGDGINDAPSLHSADVGISVLTATDVAREAADIVLGESGLRALHRGILEGRRAAGNLTKYLLMGTSSNFGNMFSMAAAAVFLPFLPMLPTQILLNNFLYDLAQVTIPTDRVDASYLERPQRWDIHLIRDFMLTVGPVSSLFDFLTFWVLLRVLHADETLFHTGWFIESLATQTLVLFVIRTWGNPLLSRPSRSLVWTTVAVVAIGAVLPFTPLAPEIGFTPPPPRYFAFLLPAVVTYLALVQLVKARLVRRRADAR